MKNRPSLLQSILEQIRKSAQENRSPKAVFDLDSTLFEVSHRITKILHDFAKLPEIVRDYPHASVQLLTLTPHPSDFGVKRTLTRLGFVPPNEEFIVKMVEYWKRQFFSSHHLYLDAPYPGAKEFVNDLFQAGAEIFYLTGRDIPRMFEGTLKALQFHGFPIFADKTNIVLKPSTEISDTAFKLQFFKNLDRKFEDVWFFENEPANIHIVYENCPHIKIVFVNTVHSDKNPEPGTHIPQVSGFVA